MKKFYVGMDIGTESVGMACTDENYNLLRRKGKDLWAVRLFEKANDASERRGKRTSRRRLARRRQRIDFLQGIFAPFMTDELFFLRLNNSGFYEEDKHDNLNTKFSLFADENYSDVEFYKEFPTIFHLRKKLIECEGKADLRLYYLALHHIIKYRGHFLFEGEDINSIRDIRRLFDNFNLVVEELESEIDLRLSMERLEEFKNLAIALKGLNDKKKEGYKILNATTAEQKEWVSLLLGGTASPKKMFGEEFKEKYKDVKSFSFRGLSDENFDSMSDTFDEDHYSLLKEARAIYNFTVFEKVLEGYSNISEAMVAIYEKHKSDLDKLKLFVKANYDKSVYSKIFRSTSEKCNYVNYIGYTKKKGNKKHVEKCLNKEEFYNFLKKTLSSVPVSDNETFNFIISEIENDAFLPKIINADNGLFPHQINGMELNLILENLGKNYPEFLQKNSDGYSAIEKIKKIFLFKIPYYVGPLNTYGKNSWMVRYEGKNDKITPWNFDEIVDKAKSNEAFIRRMTNKCSYLRNQDVLPKGSMYYQAFDVLNQINKIKFDGIGISVELKKEIFNNLFLKNKKVGVKLIKDYLLLSGKYTQAEVKALSITGFDSQIGLNASMNSYVIFKDKFGTLVDEKPEIFEDIILWHTLNTDKSLVESMILQKYGHLAIFKENIKWLKGLTSFKEFGRLSKKLLCEIVGGVNQVTGEVQTILSCLYNSNDNFNQILFGEEYSFKQAIDDENSGRKEDITYEDVAELYVSPMVRRGIWQSLTMIDEYVKAVGKAPNKIFIEVTRQDGEKGDKGRTISRKNKLLALYAGVGEDCANIDELTKELNKEEITDSRLRQERLYLYFSQLGRCAYTGNPINLDQLATDLYDVDHVIPRSITKDDSLDNKVLVERVKNAEKRDIYPLPLGFTKQQSFWKILKAKGLMSETKYNRLMRTKPLSDDDFREFISRQLVITNQTIKAVAELLKCKYERFGTTIVYSKAKNVDDFKQEHNFVKCRETNDLHHARDAYLNIVVGNVYHTKFTSAYDYYYRKENDFWREYNLKNLFKKPIEGAWAGDFDIDRIRKIASKTSMMVTRYSYVNQGGFYNETIYGKDESGIAAPRKQCKPYNETEKYGGFKSLSTAYFAIVESKDKKGNIIKTIESIPILIDYQIKKNQNAISEYLLACGLNEPKIIIPKLKLKTLVSVNGYKVWLAGATGNQILIHNAQQWFTSSETDLYVKQITKLVERNIKGKLSSSEKQLDEIPLISNRKGVTFYATKKENLKLYNLIIETLSKDFYQGLSAVRSFNKKLVSKKPLFENLSTFEQIVVLLQIVRFMKCNPECADLSLLEDGKGKNCGKLRINKNITNVDFSIIHQSPCGLVERIQKV